MFPLYFSAETKGDLGKNKIQRWQEHNQKISLENAI